MPKFTLSVDNEKIWNFYKQNPSLNFESVNLMFIDLMKQLIPDSSTGLTSSLAEQLIENMKTMQSQLNGVTENISSLRNDNLAHLTLKLSEFKKDYLDDVKMILSNNVSDKIAPLLREQNEMALNKTQLLINDFIPKNNEVLSTQLNDIMLKLHTSITEDTNKFLTSSINSKTLNDFVVNLETKFNQSEQRIEHNINEIKMTSDRIKEITTANQQTSLSLGSTISDMLKKMENASTKGKISENIVFNILNNLYPSAQSISYVGDKKESGDIILTRENKPTILVENKNWDSIVSKEEVSKFIRDIDTQNCCGLFLSQNTGIANKKNFDICIHKNTHVLLFIHEVNYDAEKIKLGIEIIDMFKDTLAKFDKNDEHDTISKEQLDDINREFQECCSQKLNLLKTIKDFSQKMIKQVDEITFPKLEEYLSSRYTFSVGKMTCEFCNYIAKNQQALSAHYRGCAIRKIKTTPSEELTDVEPVKTEPEPPAITQIKVKKQVKSAKNPTLIVN
uniref:Uncharacterized protein n=1 Tax=viral metagenome TaxID=1070528 RepID=A0A6C0BWR9_9ZZZZ